MFMVFMFMMFIFMMFIIFIMFMLIMFMFMMFMFMLFMLMMFMYMNMKMNMNTNTAIDMDVDVEMARMTMDYQMLFFWEYFDNSFGENLVIRTLYRDLLTGLDLPGNGIFQFCRFSKCRNALLSRIQSVWYRSEKKLTMPELVRYRTKLMQSGIFFIPVYRTEIIDAGIPMPALISSMPMPSYANY
jgi:hypothetical protein